MENSINLTRVKQFMIRYISSISIFSVTLLFIPNFEIDSFYVFFFSSLCIVLLDYLVSIITGIHDIPLRKRNCRILICNNNNILNKLYCCWLYNKYNK